MTSIKLPTITITETTNCAELLANLVLDQFGVSEVEKKKILPLLTGAGRGYGEGSICGAISGGSFAINYLINKNGGTTEDMIDAQNVFKDSFQKKFGTFECNELLDSHFKETREFDTRQVRFCGNLLDNNTEEVVAVLNQVISNLNPIMARFSRI